MPPTPAAADAFRFDNTYARDLPGAYVAWRPVPVAAPRVLFLNDPLADELALDAAALRGDDGAALLAGNAVPAGAEPLAQAYAGHQFGGFSPQLGDGRALLLGEVLDRRGRRRDIAFKGSGRTPFSRGGDGRAAVGPMLREAIVGEAMHALAIPTTRALAVVATGEPVWRDTELPGAVLTRVAASHLRVGTFEYFAARGQTEMLQRLVGYALRRHPPQDDDAGAAATVDAAAPAALTLLRAVVARQAVLVARWMNVGFIHGVMNTDNMALSGETIDYGPCAFLEAYDPAAVFSSIDRDGRYAYGNQPRIAQWNLARLAEALLPLLDDDTERAVAAARAAVEGFAPAYLHALRAGQRAKLGLAGDDDGDASLADAWLALLARAGADFTLAHVDLTAAAATGDDALLRRRLTAGDGDGGKAALDDWLARWHARRRRDGGAAAAATMRAANPAVIARNHRVEEVLQAASAHGDLAPLQRLLAALGRPFDPTPEDAAWLAPAAPEVAAGYRTFCGT